MPRRDLSIGTTSRAAGVRQQLDYNAAIVSEVVAEWSEAVAGRRRWIVINEAQISLFFADYFS